MAKILWVSRHSPFGVKAQIEALKGMFGDDCEVVHRDIPNSREIAREYNSGGYSDIVCVVPLAGLDRICRTGLKPLWADMDETQPADGREPDLSFRGKRFWFEGYRRVASVELETRPLEPEAGVEFVIWCTRHLMTKAARSELVRAYGKSFVLSPDPREFRDAREIVRRITRGRGHTLWSPGRRPEEAGRVALVAPYPVYKDLITMGYKPLVIRLEDGVQRLYQVLDVKIEFTEV